MGSRQWCDNAYDVGQRSVCHICRHGKTMMKVTQAQRVVHVESCLQAGGGICKGVGYYKQAYPDSITDCRFSINALECFNVLISVRLWVTLWSGLVVLVFVDNWATVCALNSGRATDPLMRAALREIWWLTELNDVEIVVRHKPGAEMDTADTLSRADVSRVHAEKYRRFAASATEPQHGVTSTMLSPPLPIKSFPYVQIHLWLLYTRLPKRGDNNRSDQGQGKTRACQTLLLQFCIHYDISVNYPTVHDVGAFAELLLEAGRSVPTVKNYCTAIKSLYIHWDNQVVVSAFDSPTWRMMLRGISLSVGPTADRRTAVEMEDLKAMIRICDTDNSLLPLKVALLFG